MRRLMAIGTLGLVLALPSLSFASDYMGLYTKPLAKNEVRNDKKGGNIEKDFISFYTTPKDINVVPLSRTQQENEDRDSYIVFGVEIPIRVKS